MNEEYIELDSKEAAKKATIRGWFKSGEGFMTMPAVTGSIPAGVYDAKVNYAGEALLKPKVVQNDKLLDTGGVAAKLTKGMNEFIAAWPAYRELGVLIKRGVLLPGPPGTGKSSCLAILANEAVKQGWVVLYVSTPNAGTACMKAVRSLEPDRPVLALVEDVDVMAEYSEEALLSMLEGPDQIDKFMFIATSNRAVADLPDRLVNRPGRFDEIIPVPSPEAKERYTYLKMRHPAIKESLAQYIAEKTPEFPYSHLKEVLVRIVCFGDKPDDALARVKQLLSREKPTVLSEDDFEEDED